MISAPRQAAASTSQAVLIAPPETLKYDKVDECLACALDVHVRCAGCRPQYRSAVCSQHAAGGTLAKTTLGSTEHPHPDQSQHCCLVADIRHSSHSRQAVTHKSAFHSRAPLACCAQTQPQLLAASQTRCRRAPSRALHQSCPGAPRRVAASPRPAPRAPSAAALTRLTHTCSTGEIQVVKCEPWISRGLPALAANLAVQVVQGSAPTTCVSPRTRHEDSVLMALSTCRITHMQWRFHGNSVE